MVLAEFNANHKVHRIYRVVVGCGAGVSPPLSYCLTSPIGTRAAVGWGPRGGVSGACGVSRRYDGGEILSVGLASKLNVDYRRGKKMH